MRTGAKNIPTNNVEVVLNCTLSAVGLLQDVRPPVVFKGPKQDITDCMLMFSSAYVLRFAISILNVSARDAR